MAEFFTGHRHIQSFTLSESNGKRIIECNIREGWEPIIHETVKCGASITCKLVRRIGLRKSDKEVLENNLKTAIGIGGLAKFEAQAKESLLSEVVLDMAFEEERTVVFPSPKYGRYTALQYQKKRFYDINFQDTRFLHKDSWKHTICEHTKYYHDDSKKIEYDPSCDPPPVVKPDYDGLYQIDLGNTSFLVGFTKLDKSIVVDFTEKELILEPPPFLIFKTTIPKSYIPEAIIFLGNITDEIVEAIFHPYIEKSIEIPWSNQEELEYKIDIQDQNEGSLEAEF